MLARRYYNLPHPTWRSHTTPDSRAGERKQTHHTAPAQAVKAINRPCRRPPSSDFRRGRALRFLSCISRPRTGRADRNGTDSRLSGDGYTQRTSRKSEPAAIGIGKTKGEIKIAASVARPSARRPISKGPRAGPASMGVHSAAVGTRPVSLVGRAEGACALASVACFRHREQREIPPASLAQGRRQKARREKSRKSKTGTERVKKTGRHCRAPVSRVPS